MNKLNFLLLMAMLACVPQINCVQAAPHILEVLIAMVGIIGFSPPRMLMENIVKHLIQ